MNFFERQKQRKKQQLLNDIKNKQQMEEYRGNQSALGLGSKAVSAIKDKFGNTGTGIIADYADDAIKGVTTQSSSAVGNAVAKEVAKEATEEATKKIATEGLKNGLGKAMPVVGGAMSAKSAYDRASKGDYVGAGLDAVAGVASFVPGIGTAIAMGAQALNAMKDLKKADEMKAIAKSQEAIAENQSSALGNLNDKKQEIKEQQANNFADMQSQMQPQQSNALTDALANEIPEPDVFTPNDALTLNTEPSGMATANVQQPEIVNPVFNQPEVAQPADNSSKIAGLLNAVKSMGGAVDNKVDLAQEKIGGMVDTALAKTKSGVNDFMAGYADNRNNGFAQGDFYNQIKEQEPQATTDEQGNVVLQGGVEDKKKSIMAMLGELAGTTGRLASNPYLQGLVAGGIYKATGGDAGESIKYGVDWAKNKAKSDYYANAIGKTPGVLIGDYDATDYNAHVNKGYKDQMVTNMANRIKAMEENYANQQKDREEKLAFLKDKFGKEFGEKVRHNKATEGIQATNANFKKEKYDKQLKLEEAMNEDLMDYIDILGEGDVNLISEAEKDLVGTYGADILKHLKILEEKYGEPKNEKLGFWGKK